MTADRWLVGKPQNRYYAPVVYVCVCELQQFIQASGKKRATNGYQICIVLAEWIARFSLCGNYVFTCLYVCVCVCGYCCNMWIAKSALFPFHSVCKYIRLDMNRLDCHHSQNGHFTRKSRQQQQKNLRYWGCKFRSIMIVIPEFGYCKMLTQVKKDDSFNTTTTIIVIIIHWTRETGTVHPFYHDVIGRRRRGKCFRNWYTRRHTYNFSLSLSLLLDEQSTR